MNKNIVMGAIAVAALGVAIFLMLTRGDTNNEDPAEGMSQLQVWVCADCKAETAMTKRQMVDAYAAGTFGCQACKGHNLRDAVYCTNPACGKAMELLGHGMSPSSCPHCNASFGEWRNLDPASAAPPPG